MKQISETQRGKTESAERSEFSRRHEQPSEKGKPIAASKEGKSADDSRYVNKEEADWYVTQKMKAADDIKKELLEEKNLKELIRQFLGVIHDCMKELKLQVDTMPENKDAIVSTVVDYVGTGWRAWLRGEPVMPSGIWKELIHLKFDTQVTEEEKITKQLEEGILPEKYGNTRGREGAERGNQECVSSYGTGTHAQQ